MKTCNTCIHKEICNLHHYGNEAVVCKHYRTGSEQIFLIRVYSKRLALSFTLDNIFRDLIEAQKYILNREDKPLEVAEHLYISDLRVYTIKEHKLV